MIKYLNIENKWLGAKLTNLVVTPEGGLKIMDSQTSGTFLIGPISNDAQINRWQRLLAYMVPLPDGGHFQFATMAEMPKLSRPNIHPHIRPLPFSSFTRKNKLPPPPPVTVGEDWRIAPRDMLYVPLSHEPNMWLWVSGTLERKTAANDSPMLWQLRLDYDRPSWADALPSVYRQTPEDAGTLARFLAPFQDTLEEAEERLDNLNLCFDPGATTPDGTQDLYLDWLASWLSFQLDETWSDDKRRSCLTEVFSYYGLRGTCLGLRWLIKCHAGVDVNIDQPPPSIPSIIASKIDMPLPYDFLVTVDAAELSRAGITREALEAVVQKYSPANAIFSIVQNN